MKNKIKNIVVTSVFVCFVAFFVVLCTITHFNPNDYSSVEKRPLAQFPTDVTWADVLNNKSEVDPETGNVKKSPIAQFGAYVIDQFPFREFFRSLKAHFAMDVLNMKENNGYAVEGMTTNELADKAVQGDIFIYVNGTDENIENISADLNMFCFDVVMIGK